MAGELLALLTGLALRRGRDKQQHQAQDRQDQLLGQQRATAVIGELPSFYKSAQTMPEDAQTRFLAGIRSLLPGAQQGAVYVPGETGEAAPPTRTFDVADQVMPQGPTPDGLMPMAPRTAQVPITNTVMGAMGERTPFLHPPVAPLDPKDALSLIQALGGQNGDSRQAMAAFLRANVPSFKADVSDNAMTSLGASPEDQARLAGIDKTKADTLQTQQETNKLTQFQPLEFEALLKDNKLKNQSIVGATLDNKLKLPKFNEDVRHNKENERLNGRAIDAGLFNGNANRSVQMRAQDLQAEDQEADRDLAAQRLEFEKSKPREDASQAEKFEYARRKNAFDGIDALAARRDGDKGPTAYIQKIDTVLESGKDADGEPLSDDKRKILQKTREQKVQERKRINEDIKARKRDLAPNPTKKTSFLAQPRDPSGRFTLPAPQSQRVIFTPSNNNA